MKKLLFVALVISAFYLTACCSCDAQGNNTVKGRIAVVGNEPFTRLAIIVDDSKVYILDCSEELKKELLKKQGWQYAIQFSGSRKELGSDVIAVEKAVPLDEE
jgi:hypothetical protein